MTDSILDFFPTTEHIQAPRKSQEVVLLSIEKAFKEGKRVVILEAPVGSGKSAIAVTIARYFGQAHVITPRKSLQDQYFDDFMDHLSVLKGRSAYPCTYEMPERYYTNVVRQISSGGVPQPLHNEPNCSTAPCRESGLVWKACTENGQKPCPYSVAVKVAQESNVVVHNLHSFIAQTMYTGQFEKRPVMIVDEAHELEGIIRDFLIRTVSVNTRIPEDAYTPKTSLEEWCSLLSDDRYAPQDTPADALERLKDEFYESPRDKYLQRIQSILEASSTYSDGVTVIVDDNLVGTRCIGSKVSFVPHSIGRAAERMVMSYGEKVVLMSGTIYDKAIFCKKVGISIEEAHFIRIPSSFPAKNCPIYLKKSYMVDTSHRAWRDNFQEVVEKVKSVLSIFKDVKGLIHAPSYDSMYELEAALNDPRIMTHGRTDLSRSLEAFYEAAEPRVFISPSCQQGVDFKGDRARFQVILRVPYPNANDPFIRDMADKDFSWYEYQALVVFGQMVGRVNRSENDFGATILLDSRFEKFVAKQRRRLPTWLQQCFIRG